VLFWLARLPFLSAHDLAIVLNAADHSGVHRRLRRLAQQGLVAHIVPSSEDLTPQWRSYLTNAGMSHAAQLAGLDPAAFARDWRLTDAGLLRRLIRLEQLVSSRGFLLDLLAGVRARGEPGLVLYACRSGPCSGSTAGAPRTAPSLTGGLRRRGSRCRHARWAWRPQHDAQAGQQDTPPARDGLPPGWSRTQQRPHPPHVAPEPAHLPGQGQEEKDDWRGQEHAQADQSKAVGVQHECDHPGGQRAAQQSAQTGCGPQEVGPNAELRGRRGRDAATPHDLCAPYAL